MFRYLHANDDSIVRPARLKVTKLRLYCEKFLALLIFAIKLRLVQFDFELDSLRICRNNRPSEIVNLVVVVNIGCIILARLYRDCDTLSQTFSRRLAIPCLLEEATNTTTKGICQYLVDFFLA